VLLGVVASAIWDGLKHSWPQHLAIHDILLAGLQLLFFIAFAGVAVYSGMRIARKSQPWLLMAADDAKHMRDRIFAIWDDPQPSYLADDPSIVFRMTIVNATVFRLVPETGHWEGETFYDRQALKDAPRILNQSQLASTFSIGHGERVSLLIKQLLSPAVAQRVKEQKGHVRLDFGKAYLSFRVEGEGAPANFRLHGNDDVTVADRD
jgi:hypothetical protein